jgi:uncharacterized caspase-like protein
MFRVIVLALALLPSLAYAEARIALVIANQAYTQPGAQLSNTYRDGEVVKAALEKAGFKVWVVKDTASEGALLQAIGEHVQRLAEAGSDAVRFLYYSGHGAADRPDGANYLIPTAAPLSQASQLPLMAVQLDRITQTLTNTGRMSFVVFDACRNVPLVRETKDIAFKGFAPLHEQNGLLVAFATEPGNVAVDQSLYAKALAETLVKPGLEAGQVFRQVRLRVRAATGSAQSPEYFDKRDHDFSFADAPASVRQPSAVTRPNQTLSAAKEPSAAALSTNTPDQDQPSSIQEVLQRCVTLPRHPDREAIVARLVATYRSGRYEYSWWYTDAKLGERKASAPIRSVTATKEALEIDHGWQGGRIQLVPVGEFVGTRGLPNKRTQASAIDANGVFVEGMWSQNRSYGCIQFNIDDESGVANWSWPVIDSTGAETMAHGVIRKVSNPDGKRRKQK